MNNQSPGTLGAALTPSPRETQINREFASLSKEVAENSELSHKLCERLSPIIRSEPEPSEKIDKLPPEEYLVPMADMLRAGRKEIARSNALLRGILARAEV